MNAGPLQVTAVPTLKSVGMVLGSDGRQATSLHAIPWGIEVLAPSLPSKFWPRLQMLELP